MKWYVIICLAIVARFFSSANLALIDPSEARFVVASQSLILQNDWLSPQVISNHGAWETYLAKPPLLMWCIAASMKLFGMNELASRIPSFIATAGILLLLLFFKRSSSSEEKFTLSLVYLTTVSVFGFFMVAITDTLLTFFMLGAILLFYEDQKFYKALSALFVALGVLTKGPLALVLPAGVIMVTSIVSRDFSSIKKYPWITGIASALIILLPVAWIFESRHPGFLHYYLLEENFNRYLSAHPGIKFGTAHREPLGMIWIFGFVCMLPWSLFLLRRNSWKRLKAFSTFTFEERLPVIMCFVPLVFFTFARQILPTYAYLCVPGIVLIIAPHVHSYLTEMKRSVIINTCVSTIILTLLVGHFFIIRWYVDFGEASFFSFRNIFSWCVALVFYVVILFFSNSPQKPLLYVYSLLLSVFILLSPYLSATRSAASVVFEAKRLGIQEINTIHIRSHSMHFYGAREGVRVNLYDSIETFLSEAPPGAILAVKNERNATSQIGSAVHLTSIKISPGWYFIKKSEM